MSWPIVPLARVVEVESGFGFPPEYQGVLRETVPFFKVSDMNLSKNSREMREWNNTISRETLVKIKAKTFPAGTVIFPKIGAAIATGKKRRLVCDGTFDNNVMGLVPRNVVAGFLYYWTLQFDFTTISNIGPVPSIRKTTVEALPFPFPATKEQGRIVELLDQADWLRLQRTEGDALGHQILPTLFRRSFGDPATNPKGWPTKPVRQALRMMSGGTPSKENAEFWNGNIPWVSPKDMKSVIISDTEDHITEDAIKNSAASLVPEGAAMMVVRSGILAHSVPVALAARSMAINQDLKGMAPNPEETEGLEPYYVLAWLLTSKQTLLGCVKRGATVHSIDSGSFQALPFMLPPPQVQEPFVRQFKELLALQVKQKESASMIENLFATMLHRAFTGELTAKWREAHVKELLAEMEQQARLLNLPRAA